MAKISLSMFSHFLLSLSVPIYQVIHRNVCGVDSSRLEATVLVTFIMIPTPRLFPTYLGSFSGISTFVYAWPCFTNDKRIEEMNESCTYIHRSMLRFHDVASTLRA
jgi:hypothetical protein